eukprot:6183619-Pleurochrysis_carterae.AAC.2
MLEWNVERRTPEALLLAARTAVVREVTSAAHRIADVDDSVAGASIGRARNTLSSFNAGPEREVAMPAALDRMAVARDAPKPKALRP